jgi:hypothetical protein
MQMTKQAIHHMVVLTSSYVGQLLFIQLCMVVVVVGGRISSNIILFDCGIWGMSSILDYAAFFFSYLEIMFILRQKNMILIFKHNCSNL